nr:uncharacterized protein LOC113820389 [Penaeus vannamei]
MIMNLSPSSEPEHVIDIFICRLKLFPGRVTLSAFAVLLTRLKAELREVLKFPGLSTLKTVDNGISEIRTDPDGPATVLQPITASLMLHMLRLSSQSERATRVIEETRRIKLKIDMYLLARTLAAVTLGSVMSGVHSDTFYAPDSDFLSALYLSSLDFSDVAPLQRRSLLMSEHYEDTNSTAFIPKPRKRRTIRLHPLGLAGDVEYRFNIPLAPIYNSTVLLLQIQSGYSGKATGVVDTGKSWDYLKPFLDNAEAVVSLFGLNGGACLRRAVCEVASAPSIRPTVHRRGSSDLRQRLVKGRIPAEELGEGRRKYGEIPTRKIHGSGKIRQRERRLPEGLPRMRCIFC